MIDQKALQKIIQTAELSKKDLVLEIGAGLGNLSQALALRVKKVIAVEKDPRLCQALKDILKNYQNIQIVCEDILNYQPKAENYKIVANLPYYITGPTIRMFLEAKNRPKAMTLLIQKEVARRICAKPPKMNLLAVAVQFYSQPKIISYLSKKSFWPQPKVDSAIIKITNIQKPKGVNREKFFKIVKAGFAHPRKKLINNLPGEATKKALAECHLDTQARAQNLSVNDWLNLTASMDEPG